MNVPNVTKFVIAVLVCFAFASIAKAETWQEVRQDCCDAYNDNYTYYNGAVFSLDELQTRAFNLAYEHTAWHEAMSDWYAIHRSHMGMMQQMTLDGKMMNSSSAIVEFTDYLCEAESDIDNGLMYFGMGDSATNDPDRFMYFGMALACFNSAKNLIMNSEESMEDCEWALFSMMLAADHTSGGVLHDDPPTSGECDPYDSNDPVELD